MVSRRVTRSRRLARLRSRAALLSARIADRSPAEVQIFTRLRFPDRLRWYALAKIFETADRFIFVHTHIVGGHTVKHLAAASAGYWVLRMLRLREPSPPEFIAR